MIPINHSRLFPRKLLETKITNPTSWAKILKLAAFFPSIIHESIMNFPHKMLTFDALVGENACHTRAAKLTDLITAYKNDPQIQEEFNQISEKAADVFERLKQLQFKSTDSGTTFNQFLEKYELNFHLTERVHYLSQCYFLNLIKKQEFKSGRLIQKTNHKLLTTHHSLSNSEAIALIEMHQRELAMNSCEYFYNEASLLLKNTLASLFPRQLHREDRSSRAAIPAFIAMDVLISRVIEKKQSILLRIFRCEGEEVHDQVEIPFLSSIEQGVFSPIDQSIENEPCIVIQGFVKYPAGQFEEKSSYRDKLLKTPLLDILMANAAALPQYAGYHPDTPLPFEEWHEEVGENDQVDALKDQEKKYQDYKELSLMGFSYNNPSLFCIDHIYCEIA